ncbi:hypothetical protein K6119_02150 [Paracrocinitomix mangrovi]|uniref:hypothetical protein n=1 Tax=Paracrocinitomix mangrovi TaxID=2862509 RepID=UPI001C8EF70A|nr:hypothetical protein [Paracrocinitomix mangrovi]UKN02321.1 hypothetical protein K6119_02150 [Paracrocinitomix mangrovi]
MKAKHFQLGIFSLILGLTLVSCRKDKEVEDPNANLSIHDTIPFFGFDESAVWVFANDWDQSAPLPPYSHEVYLDTFTYYFDGDTVMDRSLSTDWDITEYTGVNTYKRLRFIKKTSVFIDPNNPISQNPDYVTTKEGIAAYFRYEQDAQKVIVAKRSGSNYNLEANDLLLYDFSLNAGDTVPYNARLASWQNYTVSGVYPYYYKADAYWKKFVLTNDNGEEFIYIDGMGSFTGLLNTFTKGLVSFHSDQFDYVP